MNRPLTAADRAPQPGDTLLTHFDGLIEIRGDCGHAALILQKNTYLTRLGWPWILGGIMGGMNPYTVKPAEYRSRADGGSVTHPIDAGAWV